MEVRKIKRNKPQSEKPGFTIIEVVLVLAVAGLIMAMVFIAFPALKRGQRDAQRKQDVARFANAVIEYQRHNSGSIPCLNDNTWCLSGLEFINNYIDEDYDHFINHLANKHNCSEKARDPDGTCYQFYFEVQDSWGPPRNEVGETYNANLTPWVADHHVVVISNGVACGEMEGTWIFTGKVHDFAVQYPTETFESESAQFHRDGTTICVDNSD